MKSQFTSMASLEWGVRLLAREPFEQIYVDKHDPKNAIDP